VETIQRQKTEKYAFAKFLTELLVTSGFVENKTARAFLAEYAEELYQLKYNSTYEPVRVRLATKIAKAKSDDMRILQKVADFTVKEPIAVKEPVHGR
jgi:mannitol/fructose-specific phosphotransferase system IIA component